MVAGDGISSVKHPNNPVSYLNLFLKCGHVITLNPGCTHLILAITQLKSCPQQQLEIVKLLRCHGADVIACDNKGRSQCFGFVQIT